MRDPLLDALFTPFPPVRPGLAMLRRLGAADALDLARLLLLPVRRMAEERFRGTAGPALLAGNAAHADASPDGTGSGAYGWLLAMLAQDVGFPVPEGGSSALARALVGAAEERGARMRTGQRVVEVEVAAGRAVAVRTAAGLRVKVRRAVLADVPATALHRDMLDPALLPARLRQRLEAFEWDAPTLKLTWAVGGRVPWRARGAVGAGTVHLGQDADGLVHWAADLSTGRLPESPFCLMGQTTTADPTRSPAGTESLWAYTHLPRRVQRAGGEGADDAARLAEVADVATGRVEAVVEAHAPGFRDLVVERLVQGPQDLQREDPSLVTGAVGGGTAQPHQQLLFRPWPGLGRPETLVEGLYLASASAHPGGGVHGACGWNAARAALAGAGPLGAPWRRAVTGVTRRLHPDRSTPALPSAEG